MRRTRRFVPGELGATRLALANVRELRHTSSAAWCSSRRASCASGAELPYAAARDCLAAIGSRASYLTIGSSGSPATCRRRRARRHESLTGTGCGPGRIVMSQSASLDTAREGRMGEIFLARTLGRRRFERLSCSAAACTSRARPARIAALVEEERLLAADPPPAKVCHVYDLEEAGVRDGSSSWSPRGISRGSSSTSPAAPRRSGYPPCARVRAGVRRAIGDPRRWAWSNREHLPTESKAAMSLRDTAGVVKVLDLASAPRGRCHQAPRPRAGRQRRPGEGQAHLLRARASSPAAGRWRSDLSRSASFMQDVRPARSRSRDRSAPMRLIRFVAALPAELAAVMRTRARADQGDLASPRRPS